NAAALSAVYNRHFQDSRRERLFISSTSFFLTWALVRGLVHLIRANIGPFHNLSAGGTHVHHLVWGILLLLVGGYIAQIESPTSKRRVRVIAAAVFGAGAALTLDEFALWFYLADVYWTRQGRDSVDVAILFGSLLSLGVWGGAFLGSITKHFARHAVAAARTSVKEAAGLPAQPQVGADPPTPKS
ncbi:MAG: hypothetical protein M3Z13_04050, partial [Candidatus Dormibacteraeota bacterium]|nr:hypothetical protein [Candidatus Dormibacteraeota bacterium]